MSLIITNTTATSGTVSGNSTQQNETLTHTAALTVSLTIQMPSPPGDGKIFAISSVNGITALTMTTATGTINNIITTLTAGSPAAYQYSLALNKWIRIR